MAGHYSSRQKAYFGLAAVMAVTLAVALIGGLLGIVRIGQPDGARATIVAMSAAWIFGAAMLISFVMSLMDSISEKKAGL